MLHDRSFFIFFTSSITALASLTKSSQAPRLRSHACSFCFALWLILKGLEPLCYISLTLEVSPLLPAVELVLKLPRA